jgi:hypothetical protein
MPSRNPAAQLSFPAPRTWGGRRENAGRKPGSGRRNVVHRVRPKHLERHPAHITLRRAADVPSLRNHRTYLAARAALARGSKASFRVVHFSVQRDHIHLIVEGTDRLALARGVQGLCVRIARAVNKVLGRNGAVFGDRYHRRDLSTPREVRNAIAYVLLNWRKHNPSVRGWVDHFSSGAWFHGWTALPIAPSGVCPVVEPRTWLLLIGWRRHGLLRRGEKPWIDRPES